MHLEVETGGVRSRSAISGKMCISPRCMTQLEVESRSRAKDGNAKFKHEVKVEPRSRTRRAKWNLPLELPYYFPTGIL